MATVLVDTGVWYSIFDQRDRTLERSAVMALAARIQLMKTVIPWPVMYETMGSRFVRNRPALLRFERMLQSSGIQMLDDAGYRRAALEQSFAMSVRGNRPLSLTDCLLRVVLDDPHVRIEFLATHNVRDFSDVCARRKIRMIGGLDGVEVPV